MKRVIFLSLLIFNAILASAQIGLGLRNRYKQQEAVDYSTQREYIIGGVTVSGAEHLDRDALISMSGLRAGDKIKIPGEEISNSIKKLYKSGIVSDVAILLSRVENNKAYLEIAIKERARLSRFVFEGIGKGQRETLQEKVKLTKGRIINDALVKSTENKIRKYYQEKGYRNVKIQITQRKDTIYGPNANYAYLLIKINKGPKVRIAHIEVEGVNDFKVQKVLNKMKKTRAKGFNLAKIFTPSKFIKEEFEKDKKHIIEFYNKNGYRNAAIEYDSVYDIAEGLVGIKLKIHEGKKFYYRNIRWVGNYIYSDTVLNKVLGIKKGDVYNPDELSKRLNFSPTQQDITSLYMDNGYLFFSIEPVEVQVGEDSVDIELRIYEGEQADINKININGNTRTSDHVIIRELRTLPGNKFSRADIIRTQRELAALGYFDPEKIGINPVPNLVAGTVDINYNLEERPSDQIELSGGWGGAFGFVGTVGLVFNNFSARKITDLSSWRPLPQGDGQRLQLRLQANGRRFQNYSLTFSEPWLGGRKRNAFTIGFNHSVNRIFADFAMLRQTGSLQVSGITVSLGRQLKFPDDWFVMTNALSYQYYNLNNFFGFGAINNGRFNNFTFNTTISRNSIDNPTYPREGANVSLSVTLTPPYSLLTGRSEPLVNGTTQWIEYHRWMFDNSWFMKLTNNGKLVLNARAHMGFMGRFNPRLDTSPFERFVLGGSGLTINNFLLGTEIIGLRGYQDNTIRPLEPDGNGGLRYNRNGAGGVVYNKYVLELRYPVSLNPSATIFVLAFAEGGNNWGSFQEFNPFDLKRSMGVGARIFMPAFGLLGIDWAYGFDTIPGAPNINGSQFHFTIGQLLR
ncbi:MAG: outer membrane protein assembly factor BamA [Cytophagales bacterium]|nr:outer membrane protein assembly factor BamA [Bernardetiaceae bacterium]MDW8211786.1 outer membrane protein assembly factor BamA [Cytophagales bacterium]